MTQPLNVVADDPHDARLVANVRPPDWTNGEPAAGYNLVVIGAGTGGLITAAVAAGIGARVALVERHMMGGDCLNVGCVPSKGLIRESRRAAEARSAAGIGLPGSAPEDADFAAAMDACASAAPGSATRTPPRAIATSSAWTSSWARRASAGPVRSTSGEGGSASRRR